MVRSMKLKFFLVFAIMLVGASLHAASDNKYGKIPLSFEANLGQADPNIKFLSRGPGYGFFLTDREAIFRLTEPKPVEVRMRFAGGSSPARISALDPLPGKANYLKGSNPSKWRQDIPSYSRVRYSEIYPGVDVTYYGNQRQLEYDVIVAPGADPNRVQLRFDGVDKVEIDRDGELILKAGTGEIHQKKPAVYQDFDGHRVAREGNYVLRGKNTVGFAIASYDSSKPLIIDPTFVYSTYFGGTGTADQGNAIAVDAAGNAYITGQTDSADLLIIGGNQVEQGQMDGFVLKLDPTGTIVLYSTYFGGSSNDEGHSIAVDASGNAYITGFTTSSDFPVLNGFQTGQGGLEDAYLLKLNSAGNTILFSTYLGGSADDRPFGVAVDLSGNPYVAGATSSMNFPTVSPWQGRIAGGLTDAFVTKFDSGGNVIYSTYVGGIGADQAYGIKVDSSGSAYVVGYTTSLNFPLVNAFQNAYGGGSDDAFAFKLSPAGDALVYSTYLGGSGSDNAVRVTVDVTGTAYITGYTASTNFPTLNAQQETWGGDFDAFLTRLSADGSMLIFSTYLGAEDTDSGTGIALDSVGNIYVAGYTRSFSFPVVNAVQDRNHGDRDAFIVKFDPNANIIVYSTYVGGTSADAAVGLGLDAAGNAYITGLTYSTDFPIVWPFQPALSAAQDAFVAKINASDIVSSVSFEAGPEAGASLATAGTRGDLVFGFATAEPELPDAPLNGLGILQYRPSGATSTEVGVLAPPLKKVGRMFVEASTTVKSVLSIVNPNDEDATVDFFFTNETGETSNFVTTTISAHTHFSRFITDDPLLLPASSLGTLNFTSSLPVAAAAFRTLTNESSELLISATPIADPFDISSQPVVIPQFNEGAGWNTQIVLVNPTEDELSGTASFVGQAGAPLDVAIGDGSLVTSVLDYDIPPRSEQRFMTGGSAEVIQTPFSATNGFFYDTPGTNVEQSTGYLSGDAGDASISLNGVQILQYRQVDPDTSTNYTASETAMLAPPLRSNGRLFVELTTQIKALIAIANPSDQDADVEFSATDSTGTVISSSSIIVPARSQFSGFIGDDPLNIAVSSTDALTFSATVPVAVSALQYFTNENNTSVISAIPIADISQPVNDTLVIPDFVDGAGSNSQFVLVNTSDNEITGELRFFSQGTLQDPGVPTEVSIGDSAVSVLSYDIPARSFQRFETVGTGELIQAGSIYVVPSEGSTTPYAYAVVNFRVSDIIVSQTAILARPPSKELRLYGEVSGDMLGGRKNSVETAVAIANPADDSVAVQVELLTSDGVEVAKSSLEIPEKAQVARFLREIPGFENLNTPFRGILRITTDSSSGIAVVALRTMVNEKGNFLAATTGPLDDQAISSRIVFPYLADGGGYRSQFFVMNGTGPQPFSGILHFTNPDGSPLQIGELRQGSIHITPSAGTTTPQAHAILSYKEGVITVLQTDVEGQRPAATFRLYAEALDAFGVAGSTNTTIGLANPSDAPATVLMEFSDFNGTAAASGSLQIPAHGEATGFLKQFPGFTNLPAPFYGVLRVTTTSEAGITVVGFRAMYNENNNLLFTTTGPFYEDAGSPNQLVFPHIAEGGGYTTHFVVVGSATGQNTTGILRFFTSTGTPLNVPLTTP